GTDMVQLSTVHSSMSLGGSVASGVASMLPCPLQTTFLQSPAVCVATGVSFAVKLKPHTPPVHVRFLHSSSIPGHSDTALDALAPAAAAAAAAPAPARADEGRVVGVASGADREPEEAWKEGDYTVAHAFEATTSP